MKTILNKKICRKAKWWSEEALQIPEEKRQAKGKGEKERYIHLDAEFQRIARRDKKVSVYYIIFSTSVYVFDFHNKKLKNISPKKKKTFFLSDCQETKVNNRMGKSRDLFKKLDILREHFRQRWAQ
jgi:hypothetical protein